MPRSRSPSRGRHRPSSGRRMSIDDERHERPEIEEQPAKRIRPDRKQEDRARGKRLFGNILGTLQQFKKEDRTNRNSEAAKRREEIAGRIQAKLRSEATLQHEIAESERELKTLRIQTESSEYILKHKSVAMSARHATLRPVSRFLHTAKPTPGTPLFEGGLLDPSPIPLNQGPTKEPPHPDELKPLYFLPKVLLDHQQDTLNSRIANIEELITDEALALEKEQTKTTELSRKNRARIAELSVRLDELRAQVKPVKGKPQVDELGRMPREEMDVDREAGVQIKGEDGDVEVEY